MTALTLQPDVSILIVSFNTRELTRECLASVRVESADLCSEVIVVDNASSDGSADMIAHDFPEVTLLRSGVNLGFGNGNNRAIEHARGRYLVLLNTDAFFHPGSLRRAIDHMDATPRCGLAGGCHVGRAGNPQAATHAFHSLFNDAAVLTGLAAKYPNSPLLARLDRTHTSAEAAAQVDWVTGALIIVRPEALRQTGAFDPAFFLYYEEVDLCRRIKAAGWQIWYWPDIVITHLGGESSRTLTALDFNSTAAQVVKWRMRSTFLYYRKHHGATGALGARLLETILYTAGIWRNRLSPSPERRDRSQQYATQRRLLRQAWLDTGGGTVSPPQPW